MAHHANHLMTLVIEKTADVIAQRLVDAFINISKTRPPIELKGQGIERNWEEIKEIARYWGGPAPFEYKEAVHYAAAYFFDELHRLPNYEQATLVMGLVGTEECLAAAIKDFSEPFRFERAQVDYLVSILIEQLMSFVDSGHAPEAYQASEADQCFEEVELLEAQLKYFRKAHQKLARSHAFDISERLVAKLEASAKNMPAFHIANEGCQSHWDEIGVMERMGADHSLYEVLQSALDDSAFAAIQQLPEEAQYALWADSAWGRDWIESCDWKNFPVDLHIDSHGLVEAAEAVREQLLNQSVCG